MDFTEALSAEAPEAIRLWFKIAPTWNREGKREKLMHNCRKLLSCHTNTRSVHSGGDTNTPVVSFVFMSRGSDSPHVRSELISFSRPVSLDSVVFSFFFWALIILFIFLAAPFCCFPLLTECILELFSLFPLLKVSASPFAWCLCFGSCFFCDSSFAANTLISRLFTAVWKRKS